MTKPFPALCAQCTHSVPDKNSSWSLRCHHPIVNSKDSWALSGGTCNGTSCSDERGRTGFFDACGMKGKLWEAK